MSHKGSEEHFVENLINMTGGSQSLLGDDCALLDSYNPPLLIAADCLNKGVHYTGEFTARELAWKLAGVNISDFAAMGAQPEHAVLTLSSPREISFQEKFCAELIDFFKIKNITLAGGDISTTQKKCESVSLTMLGRCKPNSLMWRHNGQPGDFLAVSGPLGAAAAVISADNPGDDARRHLYEIKDNTELGRQLVEAGVKCAIDISDGLLKDLRRLIAASLTGALLYTDKIPVSSTALKLSDSKEQALNSALTGGEDFELLFSFPPEKQNVIEDLSCTIIGELTNNQDKLEFSTTLPKEININSNGYDHFA